MYLPLAFDIVREFDCVCDLWFSKHLLNKITSMTYQIDQDLRYSSNVCQHPVHVAFLVGVVGRGAKFEILFAKFVLEHLQGTRQLTAGLGGLGF